MSADGEMKRIPEMERAAATENADGNLRHPAVTETTADSGCPVPENADGKMVIGYTTGVFDLFHIGHLNLLKNAKGMCDKLIVGVTVDELMKYKGKEAMIPFEDRIEIVRACRYVDAAVPQYDMDKLTACRKLGATVLFVGDDWYETEKWKKYEEEFRAAGIKIVYFPYTRGTSSTKITRALRQVRGWNSPLSEQMAEPVEPKGEETAVPGAGSAEDQSAAVPGADIAKDPNEGNRPQ